MDGHGLQMWLQTIWFLVRTASSSVLILDEPDVYMHADLQRKLVRMLIRDPRQFIIATHSPEMLAEVEPDSVINRLRSPTYETGGLLWGLWDDAVRMIWIFDASGPPADSRHDPAHFLCGVEGTAEEHKRRFALSRGVVGFIGFWHTHPDMASRQSGTDIREMAT